MGKSFGLFSIYWAMLPFLSYFLILFLLFSILFILLTVVAISGERQGGRRLGVLFLSFWNFVSNFHTRFFYFSASLEEWSS